MARASRKYRPNNSTKSSRVRRNAKREATRGEAGEWEGPADELEWEGAGELAAQTTISRANGDFASEEGHSPPPPTPSSPPPIDPPIDLSEDLSVEQLRDLRDQLLEDKEAEVEARKRALDEREKAVQRLRVRSSRKLQVALDLHKQWLEMKRNLQKTEALSGHFGPLRQRADDRWRLRQWQFHHPLTQARLRQPSACP